MQGDKESFLWLQRQFIQCFLTDESSDKIQNWKGFNTFLFYFLAKKKKKGEQIIINNKASSLCEHKLNASCFLNVTATKYIYNFWNLHCSTWAAEAPVG